MYPPDDPTCSRSGWGQQNNKRGGIWLVCFSQTSRHLGLHCTDKNKAPSWTTAHFSRWAVFHFNIIKHTSTMLILLYIVLTTVTLGSRNCLTLVYELVTKACWHHTTLKKEKCQYVLSQGVIQHTAYRSLHRQSNNYVLHLLTSIFFKFQGLLLPVYIHNFTEAKQTL